ncbi:DUF4389 domain-containing protein [Parafrigoribacterium mesophilum]|uniref:DUF4389 domain-containing protein n=1 Tax=Parafrigoribacterium mesophilum TaxID=433646 RepID=UPI0031FCCD81
MTSTIHTEPAAPHRGVVLGALLLAFGILISLAGAGVLAAGILGAIANQFRDAEGYFAAPTETFTTQSYALTSPTVGEITMTPGVQNLPFDIATVRLSAASRDSEVFIGIAPKADIDHYLANVKRTEISSVRYFPFQVEYREVPGSATPTPPAEQDFWAESAAGSGNQEIQWSVAPGQWGVVVMNADASPGVTADLQASVRSDLISPLATFLILVGVVLLLIGLPMLIVGAVILGRRIPAEAPSRPVMTGAPTGIVNAIAGGFPSRLDGVRDEHLSRWLWLVKWLLAIPHYLILVFLWFAFVITTVIAGFAILFTGRYPRPLFTFNLGVLRWSWRVGFYSYSVLGTDRYPPFTLARTDYPADFDIAYPDRLNNGLVLVKWWLLAIPHYLILGAVSGPIFFWRSGWNADTGRTGISVMAALVLIAGVALLFTARYPAGIFNLLVGINRWIYRVIAYAALFRDEYPPFRLDQGPREPATPDSDVPGGVRVPMPNS